MADGSVIRTGEGTPEHIAYKLLQTIASNEGKSLTSDAGAAASADRKWLLDTYGLCLKAVQFPNRRRE